MRGSPLIVRLPEKGEAKAPMELDRAGVDGRCDRLQGDTSALPSEPLDVLVQEPADPATLMATAHADKMDVSDRLGL